MSVNTDPEALARMARELENMDKAVREATARVRRQLAGSRWQDPVRKNFEHLLQDIERNATGLGQMSTDGARMLKQKERELRQYLGR